MGWIVLGIYVMLAIFFFGVFCEWWKNPDGMTVLAGLLFPATLSILLIFGIVSLLIKAGERIGKKLYEKF